MAVTLAPPATRALLVPDPAIWAAVGVDVHARGFEPVLDPTDADRLVLAELLPEELRQAVGEALVRMPDPSATQTLPGAPLGGEPVAELLDPAPLRSSAEGDGGKSVGGGAGGDHGDLMAVSGDPSADGLVMDADRVRVGPIATALPSGLVVELELDGDVVAGARIESVLGLGEWAVDPLARRAGEWSLARARGALDPGGIVRHLVATEIERALSHAMWLAGFAQLLGWSWMADRLRGSAGPLIAAHSGSLSPVELGRESAELERALAELGEGRRLGRRAGGVAAPAAESPREVSVAGPIARAAGGGEDARSDDPAYRELDFTPSSRRVGDARARAELRAAEALEALRLVRSALEAGELPAGSGPVEGPRGPLPAGSEAARGGPALALAERGAEGCELARALVAVSSFDLSPWGVAR